MSAIVRHARPESKRPPRAFVMVTSILDRADHRILNAVFDLALADSTGQCRAVCGRTVIMTAAATEPGPECTDCQHTTPRHRAA